MRGGGHWPRALSPRARDPIHERIVFIDPRAPLGTSSARRLSYPSRPGQPRSSAARDPASTSATPDTGAHPPTTPTVAPHASTSWSIGTSPLSPSGIPSRLLLPSSPRRGWPVPPRPHNPFEPAGPPEAEERDAALDAMGTSTPEAAARRVPTQAEIDAGTKSAQLKMRLAGRTLLVPPDNSGGAITSCLPLPFLSRGPSKARRASEERTFSESRERLARLRQRADSLRRVREDSASAP
jgi:hypothetical protein